MSQVQIDQWDVSAVQTDRAFRQWEKNLNRSWTDDHGNMKLMIMQYKNHTVNKSLHDPVQSGAVGCLMKSGQH